MYFRDIPVGAFYQDADGHYWRKVNERFNRTTIGEAFYNTVLVKQAGSTMPGYRSTHAATTSVAWPIGRATESAIRTALCESLTAQAKDFGLGEESPQPPAPAPQRVSPEVELAFPFATVQR